MALIEQLSPGPAPVVIPEVDERAARGTLRGRSTTSSASS